MIDKNTFSKLKQNAKDIELRNNRLVKWLENYLTPTVCTLLNPYLGVLTYSFILLGKDTFDHKLEKEQKKLLEDFLTELSEDFDVNKLDEAIELPFIKDFSKTLEVVLRQRNNEKVKYFANLLNNGYFSTSRISSSTFDEYSFLINSLSYRELNILCLISEYEENIVQSNILTDKIVDTEVITKEQAIYLLNKLTSTFLITIPQTWENQTSTPVTYEKTGFLDDFVNVFKKTREEEIS